MSTDSQVFNSQITNNISYMIFRHIYYQFVSQIVHDRNVLFYIRQCASLIRVVDFSELYYCALFHGSKFGHSIATPTS